VQTKTDECKAIISPNTKRKSRITPFKNQTMKEIKKFQASDGKVFDTPASCRKYERLIVWVDNIMIDLAPLPKTDPGCSFANGGGFIQQQKDVVDAAREKITALGNKYFKQESDPWGFGPIGRLFNDADCDCLYGAWGRLSHIDHLYREWGQGYYAINPTKGVQSPFIEIKPK
jgi:hypothetical protein